MKIFDKAKFENEIYSLVLKNKTDLLDAITHWCEKNDIELETVADYVKHNQELKTKILNTANNLKMMKKNGNSTALPI